MGLLMLVIAGTVYYVQKNIIFPTFIAIEQKNAQIDIDRVVELFERDISKSHANNFDWASWDDTYNFIQNTNEAYIQSNLIADSLYNGQLNFIYYLNINKQLIWGEVYDLVEKKKISSPAFINDALAILTPKITQAETSPNFKLAGLKGIYLQAGKPIIYSIRPIQTSKNEGAIKGYLIQGLFITDKLVNDYIKQVKVPFTLSPVLNKPPTQIIDNYQIVAVNKDTLKVSKYIIENHTPVLEVTTHFPRYITKNGISSINYALSTLLIVGLFTIIIAWLLLKRSILSPVSFLTKHALDISNTHNYSLRSSLKSKDEIGMLSKEFDSMLGVIEAKNSELQQAYALVKTENVIRIQTESQLKEAYQELELIAITDPLTGIANRLCFDQNLGNEWLRLVREKKILSLLMIDIDYFKLFNDNYGHPEGDKCLQQVVDVLSNCIKRPADLMARYGGEEFVCILPGTPVSGAKVVAQRILTELQNKQIEHLYSPASKLVSLSIGIASMKPTADNSAEALLKNADVALYEAKHSGRNKFVISTVD